MPVLLAVIVLTAHGREARGIGFGGGTIERSARFERRTAEGAPLEKAARDG